MKINSINNIKQILMLVVVLSLGLFIGIFIGLQGKIKPAEIHEKNNFPGGGSKFCHKFLWRISIFTIFQKI